MTGARSSISGCCLAWSRTTSVQPGEPWLAEGPFWKNAAGAGFPVSESIYSSGRTFNETRSVRAIRQIRLSADARISRIADESWPILGGHHDHGQNWANSAANWPRSWRTCGLSAGVTSGAECFRGESAPRRGWVGCWTSGRSRYGHHRGQVVAPDPAGSLDRMQNSLPSGSASVIQPLPSGRR
jgi:hypothetical protein